ncbi:WD40 repeat-like protein [Mycena venus]|uniref:WD40 repeat-like protein n=1 Tax=Mycena venus TaxID=2733690 RepID=A0A8H7CK08_9AGAR|nr:WD40 repeat-like protein [Mycena venus]
MSIYQQQTSLRGHSGAIYSLVATDDGKLLASGGKDGTRIWDVQSRKQISRPAPPGIRGMTTAIAWANRPDEPGELLFFGTVAGYLVIWRQVAGQQVFNEFWCRRLSQPSEITGLAFDAVSNRIAVCNWNALVQLWALPSSSDPQRIFSVCIANYIPKAIQFGVMRGNERELLIFGYNDGKIRTVTGNLAVDNASRPWEIGVRIGDATVDNRRTAVCIDDIDFGAVLYRLDDHQRVKTFHVPNEDKRPRQVRFVDDSKTIVIGSDHGVIYVFDRRTGIAIDKLTVKGMGWIQTIATVDCNGIPTIFGAKSGDGLGQNDIILWQKTAERLRSGAKVSEGILSGSILLALLAYAYYNREMLGEMIREKLANFN